MESKKYFIVKDRIKNFLYLFVFLMIVWFLLTSSFNSQMVFAGILVSLVISFFISEEYLAIGLPPVSLKRVFYFILYIFVLFKEIIKANLDVAYRVIHPGMPIKPGIVVIKTNLKKNIAKLILANSITLTPGTFTLDIIGDKLLIHWINVKSSDLKEATEIVGERFEKFLRVIFE